MIIHLKVNDVYLIAAIHMESFQYYPQYCAKVLGHPLFASHMKTDI